MRVVFYQRKPLAGCNYGIEQIFESVRRVLPSDVQSTVAISPLMSRGIWRCLLNLLAAPFHQGDVNHVTGDIHYVTLLLRGRRTVLTVHDCIFEGHPSRIRRLLLIWLWLRVPAARAAVIATDSEYSKSRIVAHTGCRPEKVVVAGACISPVFVRHDKLFNSRRPTVLHVGTSSNKNLERVCEALVGIPCTLRIVGRLSAGQQALLESSGVEWSSAAGLSDEELYKTYTESDIVVFASTYEGFGLPIIEGNAVGRPVVTGSTTSMPEVAGNAACLVDSYDVTSIRGGILRVIEDEGYRNALVENGYRNAARFTAAECADAYLTIYRSLAGS